MTAKGATSSKYWQFKPNHLKKVVQVQMIT